MPPLAPTTLTDAVEGFLDQLAVGRQPNTVKAYRVTLNRFVRFLSDDQELKLTDPNTTLTVDHAIEFGKSLQHLAPATIGNYLTAVSEFYRYLFARRLVVADTADHERLFVSLKHMRPRYANLPHVPPDEVVDALIEAARADPSKPKRRQSPSDVERATLRRLRNVALLLSLRSSGMRLGEALALRRGDLDYRAKAAIVTGKGRKQRIIYFDEAAWNALHEYLGARKDGQYSRALAHNPVFARHDRGAGKGAKPMTHQAVEQIFADLAARCKLDPPPTPHWLRHWFATRVLERTQDLAALQDMLGHASPVTTRIYAKVSAKRLREVHRETFGEEGATS